MSLQAQMEHVAAGLRRALKRKSWEPDSDFQITGQTNRGYKDFQGAHLVRLGQLAPASMPANEVVEYGGIRREIISRKPPLVDQDGYAVDSDEEEEQIQEAIAAAAEFDPYASLKIDEILAPLATITDLPTHPTLSRPYTAAVLTQLADQSSTVMRKENQALWKTKRLYTQVCGDYDWVPCGLMMAPAGVFDFKSRLLGRSTRTNQDQRGGAANNAANQARAGDVSSQRPANKDDARGGAAVGVNGHARTNGADGATANTDVNTAADIDMTDVVEGADAAHVGGIVPAPAANNGASGATNGGGRAIPPPNSDARQPIPAIGPGPLIHPLFQPPPNSRPDRNIGLPEEEAEALRKLLTLWVQKQEEVCRGMTRLNDGLLKADRIRQEVLHWSKAEAHYGPNRDVEDGEDWYDKERWGLVEDLKKGDDEAEEEDAGPAAKKTRGRR